MGMKRWRRIDDIAPLMPQNPEGDHDTMHDVMLPHRAPTGESDFLVPFLQAILTGVVLGTAAATILWGFMGAPFLKSMAMAVAVFVALAWLWRLGASQDTLWQVEHYVGDLDGDGVRGKPSKEPGMVLVNPYVGQVAQRRDQEERLQAVFTGFIRGCETDTTARRWERRLGRRPYAQFRDGLIAQGYAQWNGEDQRSGWRLTSPPETILTTIFREHLDLDGPQPPQR